MGATATAQVERCNSDTGHRQKEHPWRKRGRDWRSTGAVPVGVIDVSNQQTRFVPITDRKKLTGTVLAGIGFGLWLGWRRRR